MTLQERRAWFVYEAARIENKASNRLEAAEKVCIGVQTVCDEHSLKGRAKEDLEAWRKMVGR